MPGKKSILTRTFVCLCAAQGSSHAHHFMLFPTLPLYIQHLGGSPFIVGSVLAGFSITSLLIRPVSGFWSDRKDETFVMLVGTLTQTIAGLLLLVPSIGSAILSNCIRGIGWGSQQTGGYVLLAKTAPAERRAEASGYYTGVQNAATMIFSPLALSLLESPHGGFALVFASGAALSGIASLLVFAVSRSVSRIRDDPENNSSTRLIDLASLPTFLHFLLNFSLPAVSSFIVLYANSIGLQNIAIFYAASGLTSVVGKPLFGWISDKIGCWHSLAVAFSLQIISLVMASRALSLEFLVASGILYMIGMAIGSTTTLALVIRQSENQERGRTMAAFSMSYPLGHGLGGLFIGSAVDFIGYVGMYLSISAIEIVGLTLVLKNRQTLK